MSISVETTVQAERSVLGALLLHAEAVKDVGGLAPDDFHLPQHAVIFRAIIAAHAAHGLTDPITVEAELELHGRVVDAGGREQLLDLLESVVSAASVAHHTDLVRESAKQRRISGVFQQAAIDARDGTDLDELISGVRHQLDAIERIAPTNATVTPFPFLRPHELAELPTRRELWQGWLGEGESALLFGPWGSCKSFTALGLGCAIVDGVPFLGRSTVQGRVHIFCAEDTSSIINRIRGAVGVARVRDTADIINQRLTVTTSMPPITEAGVFDLVVAELRKLQPAPSLTIFDTHARLMGACGLDENAPADGSLLVAVFDRLRGLFPGMTILDIGHPGNDRNDRMRGSYTVAASMDTVLAIEPVKGKGLPEVKLRCDKLKNGAKPEPILLSFGEAIVGEVDGRPVTTLFLSSFRPATGAGAQSEDRAALILAAVQAAGQEGATRAQLVTATKIPPTVVWENLTKLMGPPNPKVVSRMIGNTWRYWTLANAPVVGDLSADNRPTTGRSSANCRRVGPFGADDSSRRRQRGRPKGGAQ